MCILTFLSPGTEPNLGALACGAAANPHGHGYAIIIGNQVLTGHGMDAETVLAEFAAARARHPDGAALFHSRLATHGALTLDNCHPFPVGGDTRTVLAHNGILPAEVQPRVGDARSDTRILAEDYLPTHPFGSLDTAAGREGFERWLGTDKAVILTIDPAYTERVYLFGEHRGIWDGGIWYSNDTYQYAQQTQAFAIDGDWHWCPQCGADEIDKCGRYCTLCCFCDICGQPFPHCACLSQPGDDHYSELHGLNI